jgi:large repetitive protein
MNRRILGSALLGVAFAFLLSTVGPVLSVLIANASDGTTLSMSAPVNLPGSNVTISGSGFSAGESVRVNFGTRFADVTADAGGNISGVSLPIPAVPSGLQFASAFGATSGKWALAYMWVAGYAPAVAPNSWYVLPGQSLSLSGSGFAPNESVTVMYGGSQIASTSASAGGSFTLNGLSLPLSLHNTTATLTFTGATSAMPVLLTLTIGQLYPSVTPSSWYTAPGSVISVTGGGFGPNEPVTVTAGTRTATTTANGSGAFSIGSFALPASGGGSVTLSAVGATSGASTGVSIGLSTISPWLTFSTYWTGGGTPLTIFGNGYAGGEQVRLFAGSQTLGTTTANGSGAFTFAGSAPLAPAGSITINGTGLTSGVTGSGAITIAPVYTSLTLGSYAVTRGTALRVIGSGYLPGESVQITTDRTGSTVVLTVTANAGGNFDSSAYIIPASTPPGNMTVTAHSLSSADTKSVTLYVGQ